MLLGKILRFYLIIFMLVPGLGNILLAFPTPRGKASGQASHSTAPENVLPPAAASPLLIMEAVKEETV